MNPEDQSPQNQPPQADNGDQSAPAPAPADASAPSGPVQEAPQPPEAPVETAANPDGPSAAPAPQPDPVAPAASGPAMDIPNQPVPGATVNPAATPGQSSAATAPQPAAKRRNLLPIVLAAAVLLIGGGVGAFFLTRDSDNGNNTNSNEQAPADSASQTNQMTVSVPDDWQTVETEFGFSVKAPAGWSAGFDMGGTVGSLKSEMTTVSAAGGSISFNSSNGGTSQEDIDNAVSVGIQSNTDNPTDQEAFEKLVSEVSEDTRAMMQAFGADMSSVGMDAEQISINGRQWLRVTSSLNGQYATSLYLWNNDHAVTLQVMSEDEATMQRLSNDYLYKFAASLELDG